MSMLVCCGYAAIESRDSTSLVWGLRGDSPVRFPQSGIDVIVRHNRLGELVSFLESKSSTIDRLVRLKLTIAENEDDEEKLSNRMRFVIINGDHSLRAPGGAYQWFGPRVGDGSSYDGKKTLEENGLTPFTVDKIWTFDEIRRHRSEVQRQTLQPTYLSAISMVSLGKKKLASYGKS